MDDRADPLMARIGNLAETTTPGRPHRHPAAALAR